MLGLNDWMSGAPSETPTDRAIREDGERLRKAFPQIDFNQRDRGSCAHRQIATDYRPAMMPPAHALFAALIVVALAPSGGTGDDARRRMAERFDAAKAEVSNAVRVYEKCVGESRGGDSCVDEFSDLDLSQDRFENAVAEFDKVCR
jgi:hypothetical protein